MEKTELLQKYIEYVSKEGKRPRIVSQFTTAIQIKESDFYTHFSSLNQLEQFYWQDLHEKLIQKITTQEVYANYSVREKFLTYAFTLVEQLKENRSFALIVLRENRNTLNTYKKELKNYVEGLITEGTQKNEVQDRMFISNYYVNVLVNEVVSIIYFWEKDESANFEKTDAYIEKSVNFVMDILGRNWLDSGIDLLKYVFQK